MRVLLFLFFFFFFCQEISFNGEAHRGDKLMNPVEINYRSRKKDREKFNERGKNSRKLKLTRA